MYFNIPTYDQVKDEGLPASIKDIDIMDLFQENPHIFIARYPNFFERHRYRCPHCLRRMPLELMEIHLDKCKMKKARQTLNS